MSRTSSALRRPPSTATRACSASTPAQIIGIGDGPNDVEFLQECGLRIAMGNAHPDLKAIAHWIAPDVTEHGILAALERYRDCLG